MLSALIDLDKLNDYDKEIEPAVKDLIASIPIVVDECNQRTPTTNSAPMGRSVNDTPSDYVASEMKRIDIRLTSDKSPSMLSLNADTLSARLPQIPLPSFDGTIHAWPVSRDRFVVLIHKSNLSDIEKYYYLLSCLQPCAVEVIKGITVSSDTYQLAWSTLVQRFDKPRQLAGSLVDKILNAPVFDKETLSTFLNGFEETVASLSALNIPDLSAYLLFTIVLRSLPLCYRKLFETENCNEYPSISHLRQVTRPSA